MRLGVVGRYAVRQYAVYLTWVPVALFFVNHVADVGFVEGGSMRPTFNPDTNKRWRDYVLLQKWNLRNRGALKVGDVVVLKSPLEPKKSVTKRIMAVAGETVSTRSKKLNRVTIPKGHVWVEGDEGFHSRDSNTYGPVSIGLVQAKVTRILWPPSRFGVKPTNVLRDARVKHACTTNELVFADGWSGMDENE